MPSSGHHTFSAFFTRAVESRVLGVTFAPATLARHLVVAEPEEGGLAQLPSGRPFVEGDLRHELRAHPRRVADAGRGIERRRVRAQPAQPPAEGAQGLGGATGPAP